jgi:inosine-uridine nucleoside N-ribohydrolase
VETRGELTRGMSVIDTRPNPGGPPNVDIVTGIDIVGVRDYIHSTLAKSN